MTGMTLEAQLALLQRRVAELEERLAHIEQDRRGTARS